MLFNRMQYSNSCQFWSCTQRHYVSMLPLISLYTSLNNFHQETLFNLLETMLHQVKLHVIVSSWHVIYSFWGSYRYTGSSPKIKSKSKTK